jgi:serine/threonine protein kinase
MDLTQLIYILGGVASAIVVLGSAALTRRRVSAEEVVKPKIGFPETLLQKYDVIGLIGEGRFSTVFRCMRRADGKFVAVKVPKAEEASGKSFVEEVHQWRRLKHANILELYDYNVLPYPHIEMEVCDTSLDKIAQKLTQKERLRVLVKVAQALSYAHSRGVVHGDLKPSNILIKYEDGRIYPKVGDWGLGYTPAYSPPEVTFEHKKPDYQADVWSFGVVAYELLKGTNPFKGEDDIDTVDRVRSLEVDTATLGAFEKIVEKCLERDRSKRYRSATHLLKDLLNLNISSYSTIFSTTKDEKERLEAALETVSAYITGEEFEKAEKRSGTLKGLFPQLIWLHEINRTVVEILKASSITQTQLELKWKHILELIPEDIREEFEKDEHIGQTFERILLLMKKGLTTSITKGSVDYDQIEAACQRMLDKLFTKIILKPP